MGMVKEKQALPPAPKPVGRDYDAEARGKVACASFEAALKSPGTHAEAVNTDRPYLDVVKEHANAMYDYVWEKQKNEKR